MDQKPAETQTTDRHLSITRRNAVILVLVAALVQIGLGAAVAYSELERREDAHDLEDTVEKLDDTTGELESTQDCLVSYGKDLTTTLRGLNLKQTQSRDSAIVLWGPPGGIYGLIAQQVGPEGTEDLLRSIESYTNNLEGINRSVDAFTYPSLVPCLNTDSGVDPPE